MLEAERKCTWVNGRRNLLNYEFASFYDDLAENRSFNLRFRRLFNLEEICTFQTWL